MPGLNLSGLIFYYRKKDYKNMHPDTIFSLNVCKKEYFPKSVFL